MFLCGKHVKKGVGNVEFLLKKETPADAAKRVKAEAAGKSTGLQTSMTMKEAATKNGDDRSDTSHINRPRGGKAARKSTVH